MTRFSANLGFLWADRLLPEAIRAAKAAGFDAVEFHWPYNVPTVQTRAALKETGLPLLGLNTRRGNVDAGENGLSAVPGREQEARDAIAEAVSYAREVGASAVHVMAGKAQGAEAQQTFLRNLRFASELTAGHGIGLLIEPLNAFDAPGYFLSTTAQARAIIAEADLDNLRLMFDCYHVGRTEGDVIACLKECLPVIGHIQFASVPDRGAPDHGEVAYGDVFDEIAAMGWDRPLGAEYKPHGETDATLSWLARYRSA